MSEYWSEQTEAELYSTAEQLVMLDRSDLQSIASFHTQFEKLQSIFVKENQQSVLEIIGLCIQLIEKILLDDVNDKEKAWEVVSKAISMMETGHVLQEVSKGEILSLFHIFIPTEDSSSLTTFNERDVSENNQDTELISEFVQRHSENIETIENLLLTFEQENNSKDIDKIKGLFHSIKGDAGASNLAEIERVCHLSENVLISTDINSSLEILFQTKDWLEQYFEYLFSPSTTPKPSDSIFQHLHQAFEDEDDMQRRIDQSSTSSDEIDPSLIDDFINEAIDHIETANSKLLELENDLNNLEAVNSLFRVFHTVKGVAGCLNLQIFLRFSHELESMLDLVRKGNIEISDTLIDVLYQSIDHIHKLTVWLKESRDEQELKDLQVEEQVILRLVSKIVKKEKVITEPQKTKTTASEEQEGFPEKTKTTEVMQSKSKQVMKSTASHDIVKVDSGRLDQLIDTIGELVITVSMLKQSFNEYNIKSLKFDHLFRQVEKNTQSLHQTSTSLRMVPIRPTFQKVLRAARDLSRKMDKKVDINLSGEETELDKSLVDILADPLIHMIRNAMDHGIEDSEIRKKAGKPETGQIQLQASHQGGNIHIKIEDDGKGLHREPILKKAIERGLLSQQETYTDSQIFNQIFEPGFSTAAKVTQVSGRGVGMDVVKKNIDSLRGQVLIESIVGQGTKFTIVLPLTLAIIDGVIVEACERQWIIPSLSIIKTDAVKQSGLKTVYEENTAIKFQNNWIPVYSLAEILQNRKSELQGNEYLLFLESNDSVAGVIVDRIISKQNIVIKSIGDMTAHVPCVSGGTILPNGSVGLIIDVNGLVKLAHQKQLSKSMREPELAGNTV